MNGYDITKELHDRSTEMARSKALKIKPRTGTTASAIYFRVKSGQAMVEKEIAEMDQRIMANKERYSQKVADELNLPIITERNEYVSAVKDAVKKYVNETIDARKKQNADVRKMPMRDSSLKLLQQIQMLISLDADISENDWKSWGEEFAGHYNEERAFEAIAKTKGITVVPVSNPTETDENLETLRDMANRTTDRLDNVEDDIIAMSFLTDNPDSPVQKLIEKIDSDLGSIIPAERLTVLQRLKDAKQRAFDRDNIKLSVQIGSFIDRNLDRLATPEEINESLYAEAEDFISRGMNAIKE